MRVRVRVGDGVRVRVRVRARVRMRAKGRLRGGWGLESVGEDLVRHRNRVEEHQRA